MTEQTQAAGNSVQAGNREQGTGLPVAPPDREDGTHGDGVRATGRRHSAWLELTLVLVLGLAVRAAMVATPDIGHDSDASFFLSWTRAMQEHGLGGITQAERSCNYPPFMLLAFRGVGAITAAFSPGLANDTVLRSAVKVPACVADLAIALILLIEGRRVLGRGFGTAAAALWFLNPVPIYNSAFWGQVDSVYTLFALAGVALAGRRRWGAAGAAGALAIATKLQAIVFVPLLVLEAYRVGRWRAVAAQVAVGLIAFGAVCAPFAVAGKLGPVLHNGYVRVLGQYEQLSKGAFNLWYLFGDPELPDTAVPMPIVRAAAGGDVTVAAGSSWLLWLTWRHISLAVFTLGVAVILSVYSLRPGAVARYAAAGMLGLAFFMLPTEMHERYGLAALAMFPVWAVASPRRERLFFLLTVLMLLNMAAVLSPEQISMHVAAGMVAVFGLLMLALPAARAVTPVSSPLGGGTVTKEAPTEAVGRAPVLVVWFRRATVAGLGGAAIMASYVGYLVYRAPATREPEGAVYLSALTPALSQQGWGRLRADRAVAGGPVEMGGTIYLRGLGTHAAARLAYDVPKGMTRFRALVGIDVAAGAGGNVIAAVERDGQEVFRSERLVGGGKVVEVDVPVEGANRIVLRVDKAGQQKRDHVNWALARFEK